MKKIKNAIKIFMALVIAFSQLSNATLVLAAEISDNDLYLNNEDVFASDENNENDDFNEENLVYDENENDDNNSEETLDGDDVNDIEEKDTLSLEDLEALMNAYLNNETISEKLKNLLVECGAPSSLNGEDFTEVTLEDIMFVSELLKAESDVNSEREENEFLKLEISDIPNEVIVGDKFDVNVIISNEVLEDILDEDGNPIVNEDFIDGIEGLIEVNDNLKVVNVEFSKFTGVSNEEGKFVAAGNEYCEDKGILLTITFEALKEGIGEATISGKTSKYLTIADFEDMSFSVNIDARNVGLSSLKSDSGVFDKEFDSEITEYVLTISEDINEINLSGLSINEEDEVMGLGNYVIDSDNMIITILVTASNGDEKVYTINVVRIVNSASEEDKDIIDDTDIILTDSYVTPIVYYVYSSNSYLKSLSIKDFDIDFNRNTLEYKIKVNSDTKFLDITALADDYRSRVEINGNENFKEGENIVTIKVTAEDGGEREYKLLVEKETKTKEDKTAKDESTGKTEKIIIIILIILVVLGLLYLIFKGDETEYADKKMNKDNDKNKKNRER